MMKTVSHILTIIAFLLFGSSIPQEQKANTTETSTYSIPWNSISWIEDGYLLSYNKIVYSSENTAKFSFLNKYPGAKTLNIKNTFDNKRTGYFASYGAKKYLVLYDSITTVETFEITPLTNHTFNDKIIIEIIQRFVNGES